MVDLILKIQFFFVCWLLTYTCKIVSLKTVKCIDTRRYALLMFETSGLLTMNEEV